MSTRFRRALETRYAPTVIVLTEREDDEELARTCAPRVVDAFRAHAEVGGLDRATRTDAENPQRVVRVRSLATRFASVEGATMPSAVDAREASRCSVEDACFGTKEAVEAVRRARSEADECETRAREEASTSRRFEDFFDANDRSLWFNDVEMVDHPLGAVLCASVRENYEEILATFEEQKKRLLRMPVFARGAADPATCFGKVIVWNAKNERGITREKAEEVLKRVQQTGAWDCELLTVNQDATGSGQATPWRENREMVLASAVEIISPAEEDEGKYMSVDDVACVRNYVRTFTTKTLLPHIEQKLFALSTQIYNTRKGIRNQFKTFWGRSTATAVHSSGEYTHASPESQIRLAADLAMMCRDYDSALANYKLVHNDYKSQNAWKALACTYEAMAHAHLLSKDPSSSHLKSDIDQAYENALSTLAKYEASGSGDLHKQVCLMLKTRAAVGHAQALSAIGAHRDANLPLVRASAMDDSDIRAALLLERAAFSFIQCTPPMRRKFASYMILAGARYVRAGAIAGATRCYAYALPIMKGKSWGAAEEHLHSTLGRLMSRAGEKKTAMEFFRDAVRCEHLPKDAQLVRLEEFEKAAEAYASDKQAATDEDHADELACPLPDVNAQKVHVTFADDRVSIDTLENTEHGEYAWSTIESGGVIPQSLLQQQSSSNWLQGGKKVEAAQSAVCAAGEDLKVDVELTNPLKFPLEVHDLHLLWHFTGLTGEKSTNDAATAANALITVKSESQTLAPGTTSTIRLVITPSTAGLLHVLGVAWSIGPKKTLKGRKYFDVNAPRTRRGSNGEWFRDVPKHRRLVFNVVETVPRCEAILEKFPTSTMNGALHRVELVISNVTQPMAKWIRVRLPKSLLRPVDESHVPVDEPAIKRNSSSEALNKAFRGDSAHGAMEDDIVDSDGVVYALPEWETLSSGSSIRWPLWLHPSAEGKVDVHVCVCYQPEPPAPKLLQYRTVRVYETVLVRPSVQVTAHTVPSPDHPLARVIRLSVASAYDQQHTFTIGNVQLGSSKQGVKYELSPLMKERSAPRLVRPGQVVETLIKCTPTEDANANELLDFVGAINPTHAKPLFAFHNAYKKTLKRALKERNEAMNDGLMVTWSTDDGKVVGARHVRDVVELDRCGDTARTPASLRNKVSWTINHSSEITLQDDDTTAGMTFFPLTLSARNESQEALNITFSADASSSAPSNVEGGGWVLEHDKNAWQSRETPMHDTRRRPIPLPPGKPILWVGPVKRSALAVAPGAVVHFPLTAACFAKGDHVLDGYTLSWTKTTPGTPGPNQPSSSPSPSTPTSAPSSPSRHQIFRDPSSPKPAKTIVAHPHQAKNAPFIVTVA